MNYYQCRICLRSLQVEHLMGLFDPTFSMTLKRFENLIGQKIQQNVHLPNQICELCIREINNVITVIDNWARVQSRIYTYQLTHTIPTFLPVIFSNSQNSLGPPNAIVQPVFSNSRDVNDHLIYSNYAMDNTVNWEQENASLSNNEVVNLHSKDIKGGVNLNDDTSFLGANLPQEFSTTLFNETLLEVDIEQTPEAFLSEILGLPNKDSLNMVLPNVSDSGKDNVADENIENVNFSSQIATITNTIAAKENIDPNATYNNALKIKSKISFNNTCENTAFSINAPFGKMANESWCPINHIKEPFLPNDDRNVSSNKWINNTEINRIILEARHTTEMSNDIFTALEVLNKPNTCNYSLEESVTDTSKNDFVTNENKTDKMMTRSEHSYTKAYEDNAFVSNTFTYKELNSKKENEDNHFLKKITFETSRVGDNQLNKSLPLYQNASESKHFIKNSKKPNQKICGKTAKPEVKNKMLTRNTFFANKANTVDLFKDTNLLKEDNKTIKIKKLNELSIGNTQTAASTSRFNMMSTPPPLVPCHQSKSSTSTKDHKCSADKPIKYVNLLKDIGSSDNLGQKSIISSAVNYLKESIANKDLTNDSQIKREGDDFYLEKNLNLTGLSDELSDEQFVDEKSVKSFDNDKSGKTKCTIKDKVNKAHTVLEFCKLSDSEQNQTKQEEDASQADSPNINIEVMDVVVDDGDSANLKGTELVHEKPIHAAHGKPKKTFNKKKNPPRKNKPTSTNICLHYQCSYCTRTFASKRSKGVHEGNHKKALLCYFCGLNHQRGFTCDWKPKTKQ